MEKEITASFRINEKEWQDFKLVAEKTGLNASTVLRLFIQAFNENRVNITDIVKEG